MLVVWWQENVVNRNKRWKSSGRLNKFFFIIFFRSFCLRCSHHHSFCLFVCLKTNGNSFNHSFILFFFFNYKNWNDERKGLLDADDDDWNHFYHVVFVFDHMNINILWCFSSSLTFFSFFLYFISSIRFFVLYSHVWEKKKFNYFSRCVCCIYSVCVCAWTTTTMKHAIWCVYNVSSIHRIFVLSFRSYSRFRIRCQPDNKWWWWWRVRSITWILSSHKYKNHWSKIQKKNIERIKCRMECKMINHTQSVSTKKQKQKNKGALRDHDHFFSSI